MESVELSENNPFSYGHIFNYDDGSMSLELDPLKFVSSAQDRYYTVELGDNLWSIADQAYGDSKYYWLIGFANSIEFMMDVPVGKTLYIPDLETFKLVQ